MPVLHEVRDITLACKGNVALVSYENKVLVPRIVPSQGVPKLIYLLQLGPAAALENRDGKGSQGRSTDYGSTVPRSDLYAEDACRLCGAELLWWEG